MSAGTQPMSVGLVISVHAIDFSSATDYSIEIGSTALVKAFRAW